MHSFTKARRTAAVLAIFLPAVLSAGCARESTRLPAAGFHDAAHTEVIILHTNDLHFDFNHRELFSDVTAYFRRNYENVFLLDAGDIFVRHARHWPVPEDPASYEKQARFMVEKMNDFGYDAAVLGNHELDYRGTLTRDSLRLARFPLLGANVVVETECFDQPEPYTVLETACGRTVAVIGLCVGRADGIRVTNRVQALREHLHLRAEHDILVLLTHIGHAADRSLAGEFDEIDVIIGGHSHSSVNPAEIINGVLVAAAGGNPHQMNPDRRQHLGVIRMRLEGGVIVEKSGKVLILEAGADVMDLLPAPMLQDPAPGNQAAGEPAGAGSAPGG